jgi:hypothetical protein
MAGRRHAATVVRTEILRNDRIVIRKDIQMDRKEVL